MTSSSVVCCFLSTCISFRPNKEGLMLCSACIKAHTHTGFSLNWWADSQSDRRSYLLRGNQISCSPSFLSSLWVIPSSGRPLSCLSPRLHLPQSPEWPQVSFLPFFPRLSLPVFVAVCLSRFYSPDGENSQAVFVDLVKNAKRNVRSPVYCSCGQFWSTLWTKQCSISLKFNGGEDFQPVSRQWKPIWCSVSGQEQKTHQRRKLYNVLETHQSDLSWKGDVNTMSWCFWAAVFSRLD